MKDIIVLCAVIPLILALILFQVSLEKNFSKEMQIREVIEHAELRASVEGHFAPDNLQDMKNKISHIAGIGEEDIIISVDGSVKYKTEIITFTAEVPMPKFLPASKLFGISEAKNVRTMHIESEIVSERLKP